MRFGLRRRLPDDRNGWNNSVGGAGKGVSLGSSIKRDPRERSPVTPSDRGWNDALCQLQPGHHQQIAQARYQRGTVETEVFTALCDLLDSGVLGPEANAGSGRHGVLCRGVPPKKYTSRCINEVFGYRASPDYHMVDPVNFGYFLFNSCATGECESDQAAFHGLNLGQLSPYLHRRTLRPRCLLGLDASLSNVSPPS